MPKSGDIWSTTETHPSHDMGQAAYAGVNMAHHPRLQHHEVVYPNNVSFVPVNKLLGGPKKYLFGAILTILCFLLVSDSREKWSIHIKISKVRPI